MSGGQQPAGDGRRATAGGRRRAGDGRRVTTGGGWSWSWIAALHGSGAGSESRPDLSAAAVNHGEKVERRKRRERKG
jgi:hypothetical protein